MSRLDRSVGTVAFVAVASLLALQVGLYIWMAPRSFEFTDEAFYLLNLLYWREFQGHVSFFGAYFELPFRVLGQDIAAIRIFTLALLMACTAYATVAVLRYQSACVRRSLPVPMAAFVLAAMAGSLLYFTHLTTLRVPSYNLGALCAGLLATAFLLDALSPAGGGRARAWAMLGYGVALGACGLNKPSAGLALALMHATFLLCCARPWLQANGLRFGLWSALGAAANFALLALAAPHWFSQLLEGVALVSSTDSRGLVDLLINHARWSLQKTLYQYWHWFLLAGVLYAACVWAEIRARLRVVGWAELAVVMVATWGLASTSKAALWWPMIALAAAMIAARALWNPAGARLAGAPGAHFGLVLLLLSTPLALSFGTTIPIMGHATINAVFAVLALLAALALRARESVMARSAVMVALALVCLPGLVFQWRAATSAEGAYRQLAPLAAQNEAVALGAVQTRLLVDPETAANLNEFKRTLAAAGWVPGTPMLDFTGDGPGWVYAAGGRPVGLAWLLGGYPGSEKTVARVLGRQPPEVLRSAWILASDANPRQIANWHDLLWNRLGLITHERVATVTIRARYRVSDGEPTHLDLQVWRPLP